MAVAPLDRTGERPDERPGVILHCFTPDEWTEAQATGLIAPPSLETEGFVHCSTQAQVDGVLDRFYAEVADVMVGTVDLKRLEVLAPTIEVRWEAPAHPDGSPNTSAEASAEYPHVYGAIPLAAVTTTRRR